MIDPSAFVQAMNNTRSHVNSARPNAPVVPDRERVQGRGDPFRRGTAALLRRWADRVEPHRPQPRRTAAA
jgi:hypothetical protein